MHVFMIGCECCPKERWLIGDSMSSLAPEEKRLKDWHTRIIHQAFKPLYYGANVKFDICEDSSNVRILFNGVETHHTITTPESAEAHERFIELTDPVRAWVFGFIASDILNPKILIAPLKAALNLKS